MWNRIAGGLFAIVLAYGVSLSVMPRGNAGVPCSLPFDLLNGTVADATQVMANYNAIITCLLSAAASGVNSDITSLTAVAAGAGTFWGNPTSASSTSRFFTVASLPNLAVPSATLDLIPCWEHTTGALNKCTPGAIAGTNVAGVASIGGATGVVTLGSPLSIPGNVLTLGTVPVSQGGLGATGMSGMLNGLVPFKGITPNILGVNQGSFATQDGSAFYNQNDILSADLNQKIILPTGGGHGECLGSQISGGSGAGGGLSNTTADNKIEVFMYMVKRNIAPVLCVIGSSSDLYKYDPVVTFTGGGSSNFTIPDLAGPSPPAQIGCVTAAGCGMTPNQTVYFTNAGGAMPTLGGGGSLGTNQFYYITNTQQHSGTVMQISSVPNGGLLTFTSTGSGVTTMHIGVQNELDLVMGVGTYTMLRQLGQSFMWDITKWGGIPDFQPLGADPPIIRLTSATNSTGYQILTNATAGSGTIDLRPFLANSNRNLTIRVMCTASGSNGTVTFSVAGGFPMCEGIVGSEQYTTYNTATDSNTQIFYSVIGGAIANAWIIGYQWTGPH